MPTSSKVALAESQARLGIKVPSKVETHPPRCDLFISVDCATITRVLPETVEKVVTGYLRRGEPFAAGRDGLRHLSLAS
jgi:hypothetical protein